MYRFASNRISETRFCLFTCNCEAIKNFSRQKTSSLNENAFESSFRWKVLSVFLVSISNAVDAGIAQVTSPGSFAHLTCSLLRSWLLSELSLVSINSLDPFPAPNSTNWMFSEASTTRKHDPLVMNQPRRSSLMHFSAKYRRCRKNYLLLHDDGEAWLQRPQAKVRKFHWPKYYATFFALQHFFSNVNPSNSWCTHIVNADAVPAPQNPLCIWREASLKKRFSISRLRALFFGAFLVMSLTVMDFEGSFSIRLPRQMAFHP